MTILPSSLRTEARIRESFLILVTRMKMSGKVRMRPRRKVIIEDSTSKKVTMTNTTDVNAAAWTEWKIPLTEFKNVSLSKVKKLHVGVGDPINPAADGTGRVYFDDIRVTKPTE